MRVSRIGAEVDPIRCPRYFPGPDQSLVISEERAFTGDQWFHELGEFGLIGHQASNLVEKVVVVEHIREDHRIPGSAGNV